MEPEPSMLANNLACLYLNYITLLCTEETLNELVVVDLAKETYSLTVLTVSRRQLGFFSNAAHLAFLHCTNREKRMAHLKTFELCKEIGLILDWVRCRA